VVRTLSGGGLETLRYAADEAMVASSQGEEMSLSLLGSFRLAVRGRPRSVQRSGQRLVAFLALHGRCDRAFVAGMLFPEAGDDRANARLRSILSRINRTVGHVVRASDGCLELSANVIVDAVDLAAAARRVTEAGTALAASRPTAEATDEELLLQSAELLPGWYEDWVLVERDRLVQLRVRALEALVEDHLAVGRLAAASVAASTAVRVDPLRESTHRAIITVHLAENDPMAALRQYRAYEELLAQNFHGAQPSRKLRELLESLHDI